MNVPKPNFGNQINQEENSTRNVYYTPCVYLDKNNHTKFSIPFQISHGGDIEKVVINTNAEPKVRDLQEAVEKTFKIPIDDQKLIFKSTKLHECPDRKLNEFDLFAMSSIKLAGCRNNYRASIL